MDLRTVHQNRNLMGILETDDVVQRGLTEIDLECVLGIKGERVLREDSAARAERESFNVPVLRQVRPDPVGVSRRDDLRSVADGGGADPACGCEIATGDMPRASAMLSKP